MKLGDAKPQTRGDHARLEDLVDVLKLPNGKWVQLRILPNDILAMKTHWINILAGKTKREVKIPKLCVSFDPITEESKKGCKCPYCTIESQTSVNYLANVIVRSVEEEKPSKARITPEEKKTGFKELSSNSWTPVKVMRITATLMRKIQDLKELNKRVIKGAKKTFHISDAKYGIDINIRYDEKAKGGDKYQINLADKSPMTEEQLGYLIYDLNPELLTEMGLESPAIAKKQLDSMQIVGAEEFEGGEGDDDDGDDLGSKKKKAPAKKAPAKKGKEFYDNDEGDEDDEDDEDLDDDDEEDEPPARGKKKPAPAKKAAPAKKRSSRDDDEDDDEDDEDDEDLDDDDEDDEPPARGKKKPAPAKKAPAKKRSSRDDDDDDDDEDDEDLDDDEDDEDDEDDAPPPKRGAKKAPPKKPARKSRDEDEDDEDEDDEDDEDDDDEDDAPPPKRGAKKAAPAKKAPPKKAPAKKPARKSRDDEDEDDEDDIPF